MKSLRDRLIDEGRLYYAQTFKQPPYSDNQTPGMFDVKWIGQARSKEGAALDIFRLGSLRRPAPRR